MSFDIFRNALESNSHHFKGAEWQNGNFKACIGTPFGDLYFDRSELLAPPFRSMPAYHKAALNSIESVVVPLFEDMFLQGKHPLYATVLNKNLFEFRFIDRKHRIQPEGKRFQITRQEASGIYSYSTAGRHITRRLSTGTLPGGVKQTLRKNIVTLGFLCRTERLAKAIFWRTPGNDRIIVRGAERIVTSRSTLSAIFNMDTEEARLYVTGRFRPRPWAPPPELA